MDARQAPRRFPLVVVGLAFAFRVVPPINEAIQLAENPAPCARAVRPGSWLPPTAPRRL